MDLDQFVDIVYCLKFFKILHPLNKKGNHDTPNGGIWGQIRAPVSMSKDTVFGLKGL